MRFKRLRMSSRSQNHMATIKKKTGITPNITGRFAICLSLKDPSPPNPDEYDEKGSEIAPAVLFGDYEDMFMALMTQRLIRDGLDIETYLDRMLRAHFNRGTTMLFARIQDIDDFYDIVRAERGL